MTETETDSVISVRDVVMRFDKPDGGQQTVLDGVSLDVYRGETLVVMGGSGCGKSTLLNCLIGELCPVHDLHLSQPPDRIDRQHAGNGDDGIGLLARLPHRRFCRRLAGFQIARRQGPETLARVNRAPAQQDPALIPHNGTDNDARIVIIDEATMAANAPLAIVAIGNCGLEVRRKRASGRLCLARCHARLCNARRAGCQVGPVELAPRPVLFERFFQRRAESLRYRHL